MIDWKNIFNQPVENSKITYENIRKIATSLRDDYTTGCLLGYPYFKENYKMIAIDLSKEQAFDADPRATQQVNLTANLGREEKYKNLLDSWRSKRNCIRIFTRNCKYFVNVL